MTLLVVIILGTGVIFIASALDDTPIVLTFQKIIGGQAIDWTGAQGALIATGGSGGTTFSVAPTTTQKYGGSGGSSFGVGSGGYQLPPSPVPSQQSTTGTGSAWTRFAVTQEHDVNGETGIDIGTPFHTPISALASGQVVSAGYGPWGGSVMVAVQNGATTLYHNYLHLDQIMVQTGQQIGSGQLVGLSGGQTSGGLHPASSAYSTGPHTEFGVYTRPTINPSYALDPSQFYQFGGG